MGGNQPHKQLEARPPRLSHSLVWVVNVFVASQALVSVQERKPAQKINWLFQALNTTKTKSKGVFKAHTHRISFLFFGSALIFFLVQKEIVTLKYLSLLLLYHCSHTIIIFT